MHICMYQWKGRALKTEVTSKAHRKDRLTSKAQKTIVFSSVIDTKRQHHQLLHLTCWK